MKTKGIDEVILFRAWSDGWNRYMPITLIKYPDGGLDLHCQTGDHHREAINYAIEILNNMDLIVEKSTFCGPTGMYYGVELK